MSDTESNDNASTPGPDFIRAMIRADLDSGKRQSVVTRFPPEPNGFLHIGHAKSICLNFGVAEEFQGRCHLRFDDTNPAKEDQRFVDAIQEDVRWLGFDWGEHRYFASHYFERLYAFAEQLIQKGKAYVCDLSEAEIREYRGTVKQAGRPSPNRERTVEENLDLFRRMRAGEFDDGAKTLRAKIDMSASNMKMRDPPLYRIRRQHHHQTGDAWCIYPFYDFTHCLSDAIEGISHSLCTLEFENNRALYDWILAELDMPSPPEQTEFARLNLSYTVMSKRKLLELVEEGHVDGWDDPRMPTLAGLRKKGVPPEALRIFIEKLGVARANSVVDVRLFEHVLRDYLNTRVPRAMVVKDPIKLVITNYPEGQREQFRAPNFPDDPERMGYRELPFSRELLIEREDFMEAAPKKYFRLSVGREVRLRWAYLVTCTDFVKNEAGEVVEVHAEYDPESQGGNAPDGRRVKGTLHWVSLPDAVDVELRDYDHLFTEENPGELEDYRLALNPNSLQTWQAKGEPSLAEASGHLQFERTGYYARDPGEDHPVYHRVVSLKDSWAKIAKKG